ncbi:macro domain-containing protein [Cyanobium sp. LEGE 06113]|uniref:macro domain-containing protein n=1 Tax=Cyanobium sp. LEGE 06113 TaxID=1297573 RepID=UPI001881149C|nr:macro domain-containing protein [Cyanobium sp. LEGE 06113]MBE9154221.1 macro domain-containing protein [Cyanobium sp. LEGE 06113]
MILHTSASVFNTSAAVVANTVNCTGVMGAGLALEFGLRHPDLAADYQLRCKAGSVQIGRPYLFAISGCSYSRVLNFPTKQHWRFPSRLEWIEQGLAYLAANYRKGSPAITSLALPRLGCDRGGLDWQQVEPLIHRHLGELVDLTVYLCSDTAAAEGTEAVMLNAYGRDHQSGELPPFCKGKVRTALLEAAVPARFRQLAAIAGVGKQSYANLFHHYHRLGDAAQLSLLPVAVEQ